jgi:membrane peptidoglycan carboxypeptidase
MGFQNGVGTPTKLLKNIKGVAKVTGGTHPARIWQSFMTAALRRVPITQFTEPAPILAVPDAAKVRERKGFSPGNRQHPETDDPGSYVEDPPRPNPEPPTTTTLPPESTTSTTGPPDGGTTGILFP